MVVKIKKSFVAGTEEEKLRQLERRFRTDVQSLVSSLLEEHGLSQKDLAERLGTSDPSISQFFDDASNFTLKKLARIFHALQERPFVSTVNRQNQREEAVAGVAARAEQLVDRVNQTLTEIRREQQQIVASVVSTDLQFTQGSQRSWIVTGAQSPSTGPLVLPTNPVIDANLAHMRNG